MTGDMPRHSTRLSSREPTRKRRRAPPPLSVTNVFADSRVPANSESLWRWPVTSWYLGDVGNADLHIISDRPFVNNVTNLPPLEKHYRLRWLEEDATRFVEARQPQPPEPLPVIPYARQKDTTACARPSKGLGTGIERNAPGRPRKRQCIPKEASVVPPATVDFHHSADPVKTPSVALSRETGTPQSGPVASAVQPTGMKVESTTIVAKRSPLSVDVEPQNHSLKCPSNTSASNFCTPPLAIPSLSIPSPTVSSPPETVACVTPLENTSTPSPSAQSIPSRKDDTKELINSDHKHIQDDQKSEDDKSDDSHEEVLLQFVSPVEPRLMGTLTYSLPINSAPAPEKEENDAVVDEARPEVNDNTFAEEGIRVGSMDLEFRKATRPFDECFDDIDTSDELRPEILRLNTLLNGLGPKTKPLRNMIHTVVQSEIQRQIERDKAEAEEKRIITRLKQIEKEKAAAKAAAKAEQAKAKAAARKASGRLGAQGRRRRPSRKIQDEAGSDEDNAPSADHDNRVEDVKIGSMPVVVVGKPPQVMENKVVENRKLLLKPEYQGTFDVDHAILNSPSASPAVGKVPEVESSVEHALGESLVRRTVDGDKCEVNHRSFKSEPEKKSDILPEADSSVKPSVQNDDSNNVVIAPVENKEAQRIQPVLDESPASVSTVVTSDCLKQDGVDQVRNKACSEDLSSLKLADPSVKDFNSSTSTEKEREALVEVTNVRSKSLPEQLTDSQSTGPESSPGESTEDMCYGPQKQLTPLEPEAEVTTTPITEIDMDAAPDSDDELKPKEMSEDCEVESKVGSPKDAQKQCVFDSDSQPVHKSKEESPVIFVKDGKVDELLDHMPSPVSPLQAATPTCGFVVVPTTGPTKVLTSGSALVNHMKEIHAEAAKKESSQNGS